jgi:hypothetical protein
MHVLLLIRANNMLYIIDFIIQRTAYGIELCS